MATVNPTPADDAVAHELLTEYFAVRAEIFPGGNYRTVFPDPEAFISPRGVFVVLNDEEFGDVGCGGIRLLEAGRYEVKHLYVRPGGRGRGWGRQILDDLESRARQWGATELVLDTHHTLTAAGGLYTASGFVEIPQYNDNSNATRWYGKSLA